MLRILSSIFGEEIIPFLYRDMAGETSAERGRLNRFAIVELREAPAPSRSVLLRVLDHELNVRGGPGTKDWSRPKALLFSSEAT